MTPLARSLTLLKTPTSLSILFSHQSHSYKYTALSLSLISTDFSGRYRQHLIHPHMQKSSMHNTYARKILLQLCNAEMQMGGGIHLNSLLFCLLYLRLQAIRWNDDAKLPVFSGRPTPPSPPLHSYATISSRMQRNASIDRLDLFNRS